VTWLKRLLVEAQTEGYFSSGYMEDKSQWSVIQQKGYKFLRNRMQLTRCLRHPGGYELIRRFFASGNRTDEFARFANQNHQGFEAD